MNKQTGMMNEQLNLDVVVRQHVERVLEVCQGRKDDAARCLGIGRTTLYRWMLHWDKNAGKRSDEE